MKQLLLLFLIAGVFSACQKDFQSPQEQLVQAIEEKAGAGDEPMEFILLKNNKLCGKIDCGVEEIVDGQSTIKLVTKEWLFMRAIDWHFEVAAWTSAPTVVAKRSDGNLLSDKEVQHKCRGN